MKLTKPAVAGTCPWRGPVDKMCHILTVIGHIECVSRDTEKAINRAKDDIVGNSKQAGGSNLYP